MVETHFQVNWKQQQTPLVFTFLILVVWASLPILSQMTHHSTLITVFGNGTNSQNAYNNNGLGRDQ